jgi:hypothetical protein
VRTRLGLALVALLALDCGGAPWFLGAPLDGRGSIPATTRSETVADHRHNRKAAAARGEKVIELAELNALEERGALTKDERARFSELLRERARDWAALGRPVPLADDLRHLVRLDPTRARGLGPALRTTQRAAGDFWLALGENARAEEEYRRAARLGADHLVYRLRAAWGASPSDLDQPTLERAILELPERVLAPFTAAYLAEGGSEPRVLRRAWTAARVYGPPELNKRLTGLLAADSEDDEAASVPGPSLSPTPARAPAVAAGVTVVEPGREDRLLRGPTLARVLLPLLAAFPDLTAPGERSRLWAEWLVTEDPTAADALEASALIDARAGRVDAAARKLEDLVFYSADRASGHARAAVVWERAHNDRRACRAWERAALLGTIDDPRWCSLLACLRRDPGSGDAAGAASFVAARAPSLACETTPDPTTAPPGSSPAETADGGVARM